MSNFVIDKRDKKIDYYSMKFCLYAFPCDKNLEPFLKSFDIFEDLLNYLYQNYNLNYFYNVYAVKTLSRASKI